jgi:hypothetical protein
MINSIYLTVMCCPFCQPEKTGTLSIWQLSYPGKGFQVRCSCGASGPDRPTEAEAIFSWNFRHLSDQNLLSRDQLIRDLSTQLAACLVLFGSEDIGFNLQRERELLAMAQMMCPSDEPLVKAVLGVK